MMFYVNYLYLKNVIASTDLRRQIYCGSNTEYSFVVYNVENSYVDDTVYRNEP